MDFNPPRQSSRKLIGQVIHARARQAPPPAMALAGAFTSRRLLSPHPPPPPPPPAAPLLRRAPRRAPPRAADDLPVPTKHNTAAHSPAYFQPDWARHRYTPRRFARHFSTWPTSLIMKVRSLARQEKRETFPFLTSTKSTTRQSPPPRSQHRPRPHLSPHPPLSRPSVAPPHSTPPHSTAAAVNSLVWKLWIWCTAVI